MGEAPVALRRLRGSGDPWSSPRRGAREAGVATTASRTRARLQNSFHEIAPVGCSSSI